MPIIYAIVRYLGFGGCIALGLLAHYEGIPGAYRVPFLSSVPIFGDLATGKVHSFAAEQVKIALAQSDAKCDAKLEKTVSTFQYEALAAQAAKEKRDRLAAEVASANAVLRAADALKGKQAAEAEIERLKDEADKDPELSRPNDKDRAWTPKR